MVLALNTKNDIIARNEIFCGSLDASIVHPRDIKTLLKKTLLNYSFHIEYMYLM
ncbi:JAB domain-containing protein [Cytobacillus firmus]|uniref:JAB domain-containing protein n=1 Tax=Cytobacillus firmus TaxID=1399 RepID=UPI00289BC424|nr:JAB domain-containing protein [Cytobacillus firmus]